MKLIFCPKCCDIISLTEKEIRYCSCYLSYGQYLGKSIVKVSQEAIVLIIDNKTFRKALKNRHKGDGDNPHKSSYFEAYVAPLKGCHKIKYKEDR